MENFTKYNIADKIDNPYNFDAVFNLFTRSGSLGKNGASTSDAHLCARGTAPGGSFSCDTAPSANRRLVKYQTKKGAFLGGFDGGLELAFYGEFEPCVLNWFNEFDQAREKVRLGDELAAFLDFFGVPVKISPSGARVGHLTYSYQFFYHGLTFLFHRSPSQDVTAVRVVIGAVPLLRVSLQDVYSFILRVLNTAGVSCYREIVSRADMQIMTSDYSVNDFLQAMQNNCYITRCRGKMAIYADLTSGAVESLTLKSRTSELCIYDKLAELVTKDEVYYKWFVARCGGVLPSRLTRVEVRLRRDALRYWGINKVSDLLCSAGRLLEHYTSRWFRILSRSKVRGSENEIPSARCWSTVQDLFKKVFSLEYSAPIVRAVRSSFVKVEKLVKMAVGCIAKSCSLLQKSPEPIKEVSDAVYDLLSPYFRTIHEKRINAALLLSADGYFDTGDI
ncbi:MAG: hypothetical protein IJH67_03565 [Thermoguttaceae bacterium]|nr:hypothetical protein [Thermoguttaceae bacterium]